LNYVFNKLQIQDLNFIPMNSHSATEQKMDLPVNLYRHW